MSALTAVSKSPDTTAAARINACGLVRRESLRLTLLPKLADTLKA
jgi:hypothetical protein